MAVSSSAKTKRVFAVAFSGGEVTSFKIEDVLVDDPYFSDMTATELYARRMDCKRLMRLTQETHDELERVSLKKYGLTVRCMHCPCVLTEKDAYHVGSWGFDYAHNMCVCRQCYLERYKGEAYASIDGRLWCFADVDGKKIRLDFDHFPSCAELHEAIKPFISGRRLRSFRHNDKNVSSSEKPAPLVDGGSGCLGKLVVFTK